MYKHSVLVLFAVILLLLIIFNVNINDIVTLKGIINREPFYSNPGCYPQSVTKPLLFDTYNLKKNMGLSNLGSEELFNNDTVYSTTNLEVNNVRHWKQPNNGKCRPASLCGNIYEPKKKLPKVKNLKIQPWNTKTKRVNYFVSKKI
jgi:hypothetical protein